MLGDLARSCRWMLAIAVSLGTAATALAENAKLDDAWFFPNRPDALKSHEGKPAPELSLEAWIGEPVDLARSKGKVVVIDFWATWCGPCMAAIPENVALVEKYKGRDLVFFGIHDATAGWESAASVVSSKGINYPVAKDSSGGRSAKAFDLNFWPTYVVIDRTGVVRGAGLLPNQVQHAVEALLAEPAPDAPSESGLGPEWFNGGRERPSSLAAIEGKPMPALAATQWLGAELAPGELKDRIVVIHFASSGNGPSLRQGKLFAALEKEMGAQGVTFIAVCPPEDDWTAISKAASEERLPTRLCQDAPALEPTPAKLGSTAHAFGVTFNPATIVIDRTGVVRAAGVKADRVETLVKKLLAEPAKSQS